MLAPGRARAQSAAAEALFEDGDKLMAQGQLAKACAAFEGSNRIEPRAGTLIRLGECRERSSQFASAWSAFKDALTRVKDPRKREIATAKVKELEARLSYLTIRVPDASRVEGLVVTRNGEPVDPALWNVAVPVDGAEYEIAGKAPGDEAWKTSVQVPVEKGAIAVEVPRLHELAKPVAPQPDHAAEPAAAKVEMRSEAAVESGTFTPRRKLALGLGGAGVVSAAIGIALGLSADGKQSDAEKLCPMTTCNEASTANQLIKDGQSRALEANIAFAVAGAAVIVGGVMWFTGGPEHARGMAVVPTATPSEAGLAMVGAF